MSTTLARKNKPISCRDVFKYYGVTHKTQKEQVNYDLAWKRRSMRVVIKLSNGPYASKVVKSDLL